MGSRATAKVIDDQKAAIKAAKAFWNCGEGGHDRDEPTDPTEAVSALTAQERWELNLREGCPSELLEALEERRVSYLQ